MKTTLKKTFKISAIVFIVIILIFVLARFGWKAFGFSLCDPPNTLYAETVSIEDGSVIIKGETASSASAYVGYINKIEGNDLYIGVKHNMLLGFFSRRGDFDITIPVDTANINNIYFKDGHRENLIWNSGER